VAVAPLFFGLLMILWLALGLAGWTVVSYRFPLSANFTSLGAALMTAVAGGALPALLGWRTLPGLISGLVLALVGSTAAAWQTVTRTRRR